MKYRVQASLTHWEGWRLGTLEQWEGQDWPWQPGGRPLAGDSSPSRQGHGDEVAVEEEGVGMGRGRRGGKVRGTWMAKGAVVSYCSLTIGGGEAQRGCSS